MFGGPRLDALGTNGSLAIGDVLARKYRIDSVIGEGGAGMVCAATHLLLERRVAIKFLRKALATEELRVRFEREARLIGQIESDHVVQLFDVGALPDGVPYMVMEYLEGRDLARVLAEDGPLSIEDAVDCMLQVCEALGQAHAAGIVHRDLKPANLFLTRREDGGPLVKVVDFGISKVQGEKAEPGQEVSTEFTVLGSPRYMAPEQLRSTKDVDHRADLWSIGAVLFQLVTGKHAFGGTSNIQQSLEVITKAPNTLPHPGLDAIVKQCLVKDPTGRFQSAAEIAAALRPFASADTKEILEDEARAKGEPSVQIAMRVESSDSRPPSQLEVATIPLPFRPFGRPVKPVPKVAYVLLGMLGIVLAYFLFTGVKIAARKAGFYDSAPTSEPAPRVVAPEQPIERPTEAITVPALDAGRASP